VASEIELNERPKSAAPLGERLELNLLWPSTDGDSLVAWRSTASSEKRLMCGIKLSTSKAYCTEEGPATTVESVSTDGRLVVLSTPTSLVVRELLSSRILLTRPLKGRVIHASLSPDSLHLAFLDENGQGTLLRVEDNFELRTESITMPIAVDDVLATRGASVRWLSERELVFSTRNAPLVITVERTTNPVGTLTGLRRLQTSTPSSWGCSASARFQDKLLVASCDGYVGLFDFASGQETAQLLAPKRHRGAHAVSLQLSGEQALVQFHRFGARSSLDVIEPGEANALRWSYAADVYVAELRDDGRIGWMEERYAPDGLDFKSFEKDPASSEGPQPLPGQFLGWSGKHLLTQFESVELRVDGQPVFAHYASWVPFANTERRGRFVWVSGGSSIVRIADGETTPLVFDVFGSIKAPVVKRVAPSPPPPPAPPAAPAPPQTAVELLNAAEEGYPGGQSPGE
jgi:hypothetical protein